MMVYIVTEHYKAQTELLAVFYTRSAAEAYAATFPGDLRVTEWVVHTTCDGWAPGGATNWQS